MSKSEILPNRKEFRAMMRKFKHKRVLQKAKTKGAFGLLPKYMRESKKNEAKIVEHVETKEVTKGDT